MKHNALALLGLILAPVLLAGCGSGPRMQVLLETSLPAGECVTQDQMTAVQQVLQQRMQYLGIGGARIKTEAQDCAGRFTVDWPAGANTELVARTLRSPGLLDLVEIGPPVDSEFPEVRQGA